MACQILMTLLIVKKNKLDIFINYRQVIGDVFWLKERDVAQW